MTKRPDSERPTEIAELDRGPVEYRLERGGKRAVVVFHGGHLRAELPQGEDVLHDLGYTVLVPSRPGYGRTSPGVDDSPDAFADATAQLCDRLGLEQVDVLAISAGGPTGLAFAARWPGRVRALLLQCAVGVQPWPDRRTRSVARVAFGPLLEPLSWATVRALVRRAPRLGLRAMLGPMSVLPGREVERRLSRQDRSDLVELFARMRSGRGFGIDLGFLADPERRQVSVPTLVIAGSGDAAVPIEQAHALVDSIEDAWLEMVEADSHLLWFGSAAARVNELVRDFLERLDDNSHPDVNQE